MDREEVMRVLRAFEAAGLEYVMIGAAAMGFHDVVRVTEDVDLFIRATPENVDRLKVDYELRTKIPKSTRFPPLIYSVIIQRSVIIHQLAICTLTCLHDSAKSQVLIRWTPKLRTSMVYR